MAWKPLRRPRPFWTTTSMCHYAQDVWAFGKLLLELLGGSADPEQLAVLLSKGDTVKYAAGLVSAPQGQTYADKVRCKSHAFSCEPIFQACMEAVRHSQIPLALAACLGTLKSSMCNGHWTPCIMKPKNGSCLCLPDGHPFFAPSARAGLYQLCRQYNP